MMFGIGLMLFAFKAPSLTKVSWTKLSGPAMKTRLNLFSVPSPEWLCLSDTYYIAECRAMPVAFVSCTEFKGKRPVVTVCSILREDLQSMGVLHKLWPDFEDEFGVLPVFHNDTTFICAS